MKKILISILIIALLSSSFQVLAFDRIGSSSEIDVILDKSELLDRALNNINEAPTEQIEYILNNTFVKIDNYTSEYTPLITTQLIQSKRDLFGNTNKDYIATIIAASEFVTDSQGNQILRATNYTKTESDTSNGLDVMLYTTIHYSVGTYDNVGYIKLTKVVGESRLVDTSCKITYTKVRGGYSGWNLETNRWINSTTAWTTGTSFDASKTINGALIECTDGGIPYEIWGESYCHIQRGSQNWTFSMTVYESDVGIDIGEH